MPWLIPHAHSTRVLARRPEVLLAVVAALALGGCAGSSMTVSTDYDRAANFAPLKTYSWRPGTPLPNPLNAQRLVDAIDANLKAKGLTKVDSGGDVTVTYHAAADKTVDVQSFQSGGAYSCWGGCTTSTTVTPVTIGTVIVDMVDTKSNKMLWRGSATDTVSSDPKENEGKIQEGVHKMFEKFPPKP
jgi:hypothetical protein